MAAKARISAGAPIVIVMPGTVYGPNDHSAVGEQFERHVPRPGATTSRSATSGVSPTYVDDLAGGVVAAIERGRPGESYVLAGENMRLRDAIADRGPCRRPIARRACRCRAD